MQALKRCSRGGLARWRVFRLLATRVNRAGACVNLVNLIFDRLRLAALRAAAPRDAFCPRKDPQIRQAAAGQQTRACGFTPEGQKAPSFFYFYQQLCGH
jgi:hypothetical protein